MISEEQYKIAAAITGCEVAAIKAVAKVESKGSGFDEEGRLKILFEPHIFWSQLTKVKIDPKKHIDENSDILSKVWNKKLYNIGGTQYEKLQRAIAIHEAAALKSCSWGMFQIMGFNYQAAGYPSIYAMINAMSIGEGEQLRALSQLLVTNKWHYSLIKKDWPIFAALYNGPAYKENDYHIKLAQAYNQFK